MPQDVTLHVKLDRVTDVQLKSLAYQRGKSKGQLVREALSACYQVTACRYFAALVAGWGDPVGSGQRNIGSNDCSRDLFADQELKVKRYALNYMQL